MVFDPGAAWTVLPAQFFFRWPRPLSGRSTASAPAATVPLVTSSEPPSRAVPFRLVWLRVLCASKFGRICRRGEDGEPSGRTGLARRGPAWPGSTSELSPCEQHGCAAKGGLRVKRAMAVAEGLEVARSGDIWP